MASLQEERLRTWCATNGVTLNGEYLGRDQAHSLTLPAGLTEDLPVSRICRGGEPGWAAKLSPTYMDGSFRWCNWCKTWKAADEFWRNARQINGAQYTCKACMTERRHEPAPVAARAKLDKRRRTEAQTYVDASKAGKPCQDCGGTFPPFVMDYDHRDPTLKRAGVSRLANTGCPVKVIQAEIDKCELVCANCHRIRTHGWVDETNDPD